MSRQQGRVQAYSKFAKSLWGALVNGLVLVSPVNLAIDVGTGAGFIPTYGNPVVANGLATFLSLFAVLAMFGARVEIFDTWRASRRRFWAFFIVALSCGAVLMAMYFGLRPDSDLGALLFAASFVGLTTAFHLVAVKEFMQSEQLPPVFFDGHAEIYQEFRRAFGQIEDGISHEVRTVHSFPPEPGVMTEYDRFVVDWLQRNPSTRMIRAVISQRTAQWERRQKELRPYMRLRNYHQYDFQGPPTLELFLVDEKLAILSFSRQEVDEPVITTAIKLQDPKLCRLLAHYHRVHLERTDHQHREEASTQSAPSPA